MKDKKGCRFTIIAVAEGARSKEDAALTKRLQRKRWKNIRSLPYPMKWLRRSRRRPAEKYPCWSYAERRKPAHDNSIPVVWAEAGKLIMDNQYGFMVGYKNREIVRVPLEDAGKLKTVDPMPPSCRRRRCWASAL